MDIVLVHGAWHGAWCWDRLRLHLEGHGFTVRAPELPLDEAFEASVDAVVEVLERSERALLLGHSMGGAVISQAAERVPDRIERLIFLAAFAPQDGESISAYSRTDLASALRDNIVRRDDGTVTVEDEIARVAFYADCAEADVEDALPRLRPQNPAAFTTELSLSAERYGQCDRQYIECIEDQAIHISLQRRMALGAGCTLINSMRTGHSPFLSAPGELAGFIALSGPPPS